MHALLTTLIALVGAGLSTWGFARVLRHRFRVRDLLRSVRGRRTGLVMYAVGGFLLLVPDVVAGALVAAGPVDDSVGAVLGAIGALLWRAAVVLGLGLGALILWLTSAAVTMPVTSGVRAVIDSVPRRADFTHARWRRQAGLEQFPREWGTLIEHDRALARRLLGQGNHFEAAVVGPFSASASFGAAGEDLGALRDWHDPVTRQAMEALVECDRLRTPVPPRGTRDVLGSDYGRAVAAFDAAVVAAESNARARSAQSSHLV